MDNLEILLEMPYQQAIGVVEAALKEEGFGVITRIDVQKTMKQKLNIDFRPYIILGACNPPIAHRALERDPAIGLMLPCNVSVEEIAAGQIRVRIADPDQMIACGNPDDPVMSEIAGEAREKLEKVAQLLRSAKVDADSSGRPWQRLNNLTD